MTETKTYRVLVIDDQPTIHDDYRKILCSANPAATALNQAAVELFGDDGSNAVDWRGFELESAYQGVEGVELVKRSVQEGRPYALAFVDVRMPPGWDGIQTVRRIWEIDPEILVVFCSAYSDYSWEEMVAQLGCNDRFLILKKPFDTIEVRQCAMALSERWSVARTDPMTGLLNRRAFSSHLKLEWNRAVRHEFPLACVMVDIDYFKRVNDTFGHQVGDQVLMAVARRLQSKCRMSDLLCRYGGEEFCALLPHTDEDGAVRWARHARESIEANPVKTGGHEIQITASFGASQRMGAADDVARMVDRADQALLVAKRSGRNRVGRYSATADLHDSVVLSLRGASLFLGVTAGQIMTTPAISLSTGSTIGAAADFFLASRIHSAPVVDADGKIIGVLSEKDLLGTTQDENAWNTSIDRVMQRNVVCYEEGTPVQTVCDFLARVAVRHVVIVREGKPVGIISRETLLRRYRDAVQGSKGRSPAPSGPLAAPDCVRPISGAPTTPVG
jgi:diguanylate cyclase (GGDEF)-like protein